ncbi:hypothetical protein HBH98_006860 [Parastagonospora nodorum]|nr:hypothetical protein HBH53_001170 [Parastagonospora nodorum]KAH3965518.1 hypothetical protein HBH52_205010 [Parastagonospora nodorum]KAH3971455.1 hypothetical protein HBH51_110720 [Parastagonospora nodorum]KAH4058146.1 hypothetical protein HBH49_029320 [Parastagonospora nodorum]KAH4353530.1 hypothetical protein HBH98_006860 [Parastagonospora nodorum]
MVSFVTYFTSSSTASSHVRISYELSQRRTNEAPTSASPDKANASERAEWSLCSSTADAAAVDCWGGALPDAEEDGVVRAEVLETAEAGLLDNNELGIGVSPGRTPMEPLTTVVTAGTLPVEPLTMGVSPGNTPMEPSDDGPPWLSGLLSNAACVTWLAYMFQACLLGGLL